MTQNLQEFVLDCGKKSSGRSILSERLLVSALASGAVLLLFGVATFVLFHIRTSPNRHVATTRVDIGARIVTPQSISATASEPFPSRGRPGSAIPAELPNRHLPVSIPAFEEIHSGPLVALDSNDGGKLWQIKGSNQMIFCYTSDAAVSCFQLK